jgi:hypothetical protein
MTDDDALKNLYETRRRNLIAALDEAGRGARSQLALKMHWANPSRVSQLTSPKASAVPKTQISEKTAREIEKARGLPWGWLDIPHDDGLGKSTKAPPAEEKLDTVLAAVTEAAGKGDAVPASDLAQIIAIVYEQTPRAGGVNAALVERLLKLVKK